MGLSLTCGVYSDDYISFDIGYIGFTNFRRVLAETINEELGKLYERWLFSSMPYMKKYKELSEYEFKKMKKLAGDLMILLAHSDCEGRIMPYESRKLYKILEDVKCDYTIDGYHGQKELNVLEELKKMLLYSWKKRRRIIFS